MKLIYEKNGKKVLTPNAAILGWTIVILLFMLSIGGNRYINSKYDLVYEKPLSNNRTEIGIVIKDGTSKSDIEVIVKEILKKHKNVAIRVFDDSYYIGEEINYRVDNMALGYAKNYGDKEIEINEKDWSLKPSQEEYRLIVNINKLIYNDFVDIEDADELNKAVCNKLNISEEYLKELIKKKSIWNTNDINSNKDVS